MLVDRGLLRYDQLVSEVWPEYASNGKGSTTIAHVMRHEAGLPRLTGTLDVLDLTAERLQENIISKRIEDETPQSDPGTNRAYHAVSRGWLINEIVRRVDPAHRTVGQFLRDEVTRPLGIELVLGTDDNVDHEIAPVTLNESIWLLPQFLVPGFAGGKYAHAPLLQRLIWSTVGLVGVAFLFGGEPQFAVMDSGNAGKSSGGLVSNFNHPLVRKAEVRLKE